MLFSVVYVLINLLIDISYTAASTRASAIDAAMPSPPTEREPTVTEGLRIDPPPGHAPVQCADGCRQPAPPSRRVSMARRVARNGAMRFGAIIRCC